MAINNTKTRYIFFSDIDFIPVVGSHNILLEDLQTTKGQKQVDITCLGVKTIDDRWVDSKQIGAKWVDDEYTKTI